MTLLDHLLWRLRRRRAVVRAMHASWRCLDARDCRAALFCQGQAELYASLPAESWARGRP